MGSPKGWLALALIEALILDTSFTVVVTAWQDFWFSKMVLAHWICNFFSFFF